MSAAHLATSTAPRRAAIMQPTFLPWAGYFNLISSVDDFVFLDDVQLEKQSWQTRNQLLFQGEARLVSVPVKHASLTQTILATEIADTLPWRDKLSRSFVQNYRRHPHFDQAEEIIAMLISCPEPRLADLNIAVIRFICERLGIHVRFHRSSQMPGEGRRSDRLITICEQLEADRYLSPRGSAEYLAADAFATRASAELEFQSFVPAPYPQRGSPDFISHLSVVDVVANVGWHDAHQYISGRAAHV